MSSAKYYKRKNDNPDNLPLDHSIVANGALINGGGEIDIIARLTTISGKVNHTLTVSMTPEEAKAFAKEILEEVEQVEYRLMTGKWKYMEGE